MNRALKLFAPQHFGDSVSQENVSIIGRFGALFARNTWKNLVLKL